MAQAGPKCIQPSPERQTAAAVIAMRAAADFVGTEAAFTAWEKAQGDYIEAIEALPLTPDHLPARAAAIRVVYGNDMAAIHEWLEAETTTDCRLVRQIVLSLLAGVH